jgi:hypothetical protein
MSLFNFAPIHIFGFVVSGILFYQSFRLLREGKETILEFLFWSGFGTAILVFNFGSALRHPGLLETIHGVLSGLGFKSGMNGVFALATLGILMMVFHIYIETKTNKKEMYELNQEVALLRYQLDQKQDTDQDSNEND